MAISAYMRWSVIAAAGIVTTAAAVHFAERSGESASAERASPAKPQTASQAELIAELRRQPLGEARGELFSLPKPAPAPKKAPAPVVVAPEPPAPTFPYRYGGWVNAGSGARYVFFKDANAVVEIKPGEMLDGVWRLDAVSEDRIQVSFVPEGRQLSMSLASLTGDSTAQGGTFAGAVAVAGRPLTNVAASALPQPAAPTDAARQPEALTGGPMVPQPRRPTTLAPVQQAAPVVTAPATGATSSPMQPGPVPSGTMPSSPAPTGRLGIEPPGSGSMPTGPTQASGKKLGL